MLPIILPVGSFAQKQIAITLLCRAQNNSNKQQHPYQRTNVQRANVSLLLFHSQFIRLLCLLSFFWPIVLLRPFKRRCTFYFCSLCIWCGARIATLLHSTMPKREIALGSAFSESTEINNEKGTEIFKTKKNPRNTHTHMICFTWRT